MTRIVVHDTIALFQPLFTSRDRPKALFSRAEQIFSPQGFMSRLNHELTDRRRNGFDVMSAAQYDGYEALLGQQGWGLFNPSRSRDASDWEFAQYQRVAMLEQIERAVAECVRRLELTEEQAVCLPQIQCFLLPADPANRTFMALNHGLSGFGGAPGFVLLRVWPCAGNLARVPAVLARLVANNLRQAARREGLLTLGDWLVLEGLSAAFVEAAGVPLSAAPWLVAFAKPDDWDQALSDVAQFYQLASYNDLVVNVYGGQVPIGDERPPEAAPLDPEDLEYASAIIKAALDVSNATTIAAYMYGDAIVAMQGHPAVGLPPYAGFEVGYRLVQEYLRQSGQSLSEAMVMSSQKLLGRVVE
ncbi:MAG TPA: DUF2268 domain-containing putative Zn-dependent protease [Herpetosiphonaceae bacterium]